MSEAGLNFNNSLIRSKLEELSTAIIACGGKSPKLLGEIIRAISKDSRDLRQYYDEHHGLPDSIRDLFRQEKAMLKAEKERLARYVIAAIYGEKVGEIYARRGDIGRVYTRCISNMRRLEDEGTPDRRTY